MVRGVTKSSTFLILSLLCAAGSARAVECQSEKGPGSPWSWRQVDGKHCWYKGERGMDKKLLRWLETVDASTAPAERAPTVVREDTEDHESLLHSY
jgi:hypothetical protein